jgi:hypothetical protein
MRDRNKLDLFIRYYYVEYLNIIERILLHWVLCELNPCSVDARSMVPVFGPHDGVFRWTYVR